MTAVSAVPNHVEPVVGVAVTIARANAITDLG